MFRAILFVFAVLALSGPSAANPSLQTEATDSDPTVSVTASDLDPALTYWMTLVSPNTPEGGYDAFQYISGETATVLTFQGKPGATELRLHLKADGEPLLARTSLALNGADEPAAGSGRDIALAQRYGLAGEWQGGYVCPDGTAEITARFWPGHPRQFVGTMDVTLTDGANAGGTGRWPLIISYTEGARTVAITPDSPESEPFARYSMARVSGATLSEDGLRIESGVLQRHGCTDFRLTRAPLPEPETAFAETRKLADFGFAGTWRGKYQCGAQIALDLSFGPHPTAGFALANWRYRESGPTPRFDGEIEFQTVAKGPGEVRLYPLGWVKQPNRHVALPITLRIAPDGRKLAGEIEGCGPISLEQIDAGPAATGLVDTGALAGLAGMWTGIGQCHGKDQIMQLDLGDLSTGDGAAEFRYAEVTGIIPGAWQKLQVTAAADGGLTARLLENLVRRQGQVFAVPAQLTRMDEDLQVGFTGDLCPPVTLSRPNLPPVLTLTQGNATQGVAFVSDDSTKIAAAPPEALCTVMTQWAAQLDPAESRMPHASDFANWPALFTDTRFTPFMGLPYDRLRTSPQVGQALLAALRDQCRDLRQQNPFFTEVIDAAFGLDKNSALFGSNAQRFSAAVTLAQRDRAALDPLLEQIAALPVDTDMAGALETLKTQSAALSGLIASDRTLVEDRIAARLEEAQQSTDEAWLTALADGTEPATPEALLRAEQTLGTWSVRAQDEWHNRLSPRAAEVAKAIDDAGATEATALRAYPTIAARLDTLAAETARKKQETMTTLQVQLEAVTEIAALPAVFRDISEFDPADAQTLWPAYDRKAQDLLAEAVAALPAEEVAQPSSPALSGGALAGLRNNALLTAFLTGDRMVPYRADRDATMIYLQQLTETFIYHCPSASPVDLPRLIAGHFINLDAMTGSRNQMAAQGMQYILQGLQTLADPGTAMAQAMQRDEIMLMAEGDAQILLNGLSCTGPELRTMFENIRQYVRDPAEEIPEAARAMADICLVALDDGMVMNETRAYCRCAGPVLEQATSDLQRYIRANPPVRYRQIGFLNRSLNRDLQACRVRP
ncbi:MAG: hypothetical protein ACK5LJ_00905 [Paracoccus sp. (in: a-proteobacteria)]